MNDKPTYEQLEGQVRLLETSNEALRYKIRRINLISKNRLNKAKKLAKLLIAASAEIVQLRDEAHGE